MSTEMEPSKPKKPQLLKNPYMIIFSSKHSKQHQIATAASRLALTLGKPADPVMIGIWVEDLTPFSTEHLTAAFIQAAATAKAWPAVALVANPCLKWEYQEDLAWLLANLRIHGKDWQDQPERRGPRVPNPNPVYDPMLPPQDALWLPGPVIMGIRAPEIPPRIKLSLEGFGMGGVSAGLLDMSAHPDLRPIADGEGRRDMAERAEVKVYIESKFHECWMRARFDIIIDAKRLG